MFTELLRGGKLLENAIPLQMSCRILVTSVSNNSTSLFRAHPVHRSTTKTNVQDLSKSGYTADAVSAITIYYWYKNTIYKHCQLMPQLVLLHCTVRHTEIALKYLVLVPRDCKLMQYFLYVAVCTYSRDSVLINGGLLKYLSPSPSHQALLHKLCCLTLYCNPCLPLS